MNHLNSLFYRMKNHRFTRVVAEIFLWAVIMVCATIALSASGNFMTEPDAATFPPLSFILFGVILMIYGVIYLLDAVFKKNNRIEFVVALVAAGIDFILGILVLSFQGNGYVILIACSLLFLNMIARSLVQAIANKTHRILRIVFCVILFAIWLLFNYIAYGEAAAFLLYFSLTIYFIMIASIVEIILLVFSNLDLPVLKKIITKTFAFEVFMGLTILILTFSFYFYFFEPQVKTYFDGVWLCFAIVTTIGFGDVTATTVLGRILCIFLGIYGMIVVALLTSIIVNFYMETKNTSAGAEELAKGEEDKPTDSAKEEVKKLPEEKPSEKDSDGK